MPASRALKVDEPSSHVSGRYPRPGTGAGRVGGPSLSTR